jgi:hypothetical protein
MGKDIDDIGLVRMAAEEYREKDETMKTDRPLTRCTPVVGHVYTRVSSCIIWNAIHKHVSCLLVGSKSTMRPCRPFPGYFMFA